MADGDSFPLSMFFVVVPVLVPFIRRAALIAANADKFRRIDVMAEEARPNPMQFVTGGGGGGTVGAESPSPSPMDALLHGSSRFQ